MPRVSLVVCLYREKAFLERLLNEVEGCYDDLIVVHDGPEQPDAEGRHSVNGPQAPPEALAIDYSNPERDPCFPLPYFRPASPCAEGSIQALVEARGGRYFEGPRCFQQEPHWPFAWSEAKYDWILRLDADEFPSPELREWLIQFRHSAELESAPAMFTAIWPLWNGSRQVTRVWPTDRIILFDRRRVSFFGMVEQVPIPEGEIHATRLILQHCPKRKSYGLANLLFRKQAYRWRAVIAKSLCASPIDLPRWRWSDTTWPGWWEAVRQRPLITGLKRALRVSYDQAKEMLACERSILPSALLGTAFHSLLIALTYAFYRRKRYPSLKQ